MSSLHAALRFLTRAARPGRAGRVPRLSLALVLVQLLTWPPSAALAQEPWSASNDTPSAPLAPGYQAMLDAANGVEMPHPLGTQVSGPVEGLALRTPPTAGQAVVADDTVPGWKTVYGSQAGRERFPPRAAPPELAPAAPQPDLGLGTVQYFVLPGVSPNSAAVAPDGRLFFGVNGLGLKVWGPGADGDYTWYNIVPAPGGLASNKVSALAVFSGYLWVGTDAGISLLSLADNTWSQVNTSNTPNLPSNVIHRFREFNNPNDLLPHLWIATGAGAVEYRPIATYPFHYVFYPPVTAFPVSDLKVVYDVADQYLPWVDYTWFVLGGGIVRYNNNTGNWDPNGYVNTQAPPCDFDTAAAIVTDHDQNLWFAGRQVIPALAAASGGNAPSAAWLGRGVCRFDGSTWQLFDTVSPGLLTNWVNDLAVDEGGRVWLAMADHSGRKGGGGTFDPAGCNGAGSWQWYNATADILDSVPRFVVVTGEQVWWLHDGGLTGRALQYINWSSTDLGLSGQIRAITLMPDAIYVAAGIGAASTTDGVTWTRHDISGNTATVSALAVSGSASNPASMRYTYGTIGNGIFVLTTQSYAHHTTANGLPSNNVRAVLYDSQDRLWAGTDAGLALWDHGYWMAVTSSTSGLPSNDVRGLAVDTQNRIWAATGGGIGVYDTSPTGGGWTTYTSADGLPSDAVNAVAFGPDGRAWTATAGGLAYRDADAGATWHLIAFGTELPATETLRVAVGPTGRVYGGTVHGLWLLENNEWRVLHVTNSGLHDDRISLVAADAERAWIGAADGVYTRGVRTQQLGACVPIVNNPSPEHGPAGATVTLTGGYFDPRGPAYNHVYFGVENWYMKEVEATIQSVSANQIVVTVPDLAGTGKVAVRSHDLRGLTSRQFRVEPGISGLNKSCVALGESLEVRVTGMSGITPGVPVEIRLGSGPWRTPDARNADLVRHIVRGDDASGTVQLRVGGPTGSIVSAPAALEVVRPVRVDVSIQQEVQDYARIFGKQTLVQVRYRSSGSCNIFIRRGTMLWKKKDGTLVEGGNPPAWIPSPNGLTVTPAIPDVSLATTVNFVDMPVPRNWLEQSLPFDQFDGARISVSNGDLTLETFDLRAADFNYVDTNRRHYFLNFEVIQSGLMSSPAYKDYFHIFNVNAIEAARIFPQSDDNATSYLGAEWQPWNIIYLEVYINRGGPLNLNTGDYEWLRRETTVILWWFNARVWEDIDDTEAPIFNSGVALVYSGLYTPGTPSGCSNWGRPAFVAFNFGDASGATINTGGATIMHEAGHAFGLLVQPDAPNYDHDNSALGHSFHDEDPIAGINCPQFHTFGGALLGHFGSLKRVVSLYRWPLVEVDTTGCHPNSAKSLMAYAPDENNFNSWYEPLDYDQLLRFLLSQQIPNVPDAARALPFGQTLRLLGSVTKAGAVEILSSQLAGSGPTTSPDLGAAYHLRVLTARGLASDTPFDVSFETTAGVDSDSALFNLRVPWPLGATRVELWHGTRLWSAAVSAHAPTVAFSAPSGGTFSAASPIDVAWTAGDQDGDPLMFELEYSPDGQNWKPISAILRGNSYDWTPGWAQGSATARLRLTASDGFLTGQAVSAAFTLQPRGPFAFIGQPTNNTQVPEGQTLKLEGRAMMPPGTSATYTWHDGPTLIGSTSSLAYRFATVGPHILTFQMSAGGQTDSDSVTVQVLPDYDGDGMPNDWELQHGLNPLDQTDAQADADSDGIPNLREHQLGLNPNDADTDHDGVTDGVELHLGYDAASASSKPLAGPELRVGTEELEFRGEIGHPIPAQSFWIYNGSQGSLHWSAVSDSPWLGFSVPPDGNPGPITVRVLPGTLKPGIYSAHLTITAAGAADSPTTIPVTLVLTEPRVRHAYLPVLVR